jgi:DNA sulfur modification protein DndD
MIIRKLALHHFLTYHGDQGIDLPTGKSSSLTIIVGPNNSGKTSIVRALKFWFYGEQGVPKKADLPLYLNNKAKGETEIGKSLEAWVEVTFEHETTHGKETTILRRTLSASRVSPDRWEVRSVSLRQILPGARPDNSPEAEQGWQRLLEGLMPKPLFDAFYFKGEPLDGRLLGDVASIRQALGLFLHEEQWKEAESAAAKIRDQLDTKLNRLVSTNAELQQAMETCHNLEQKLESQQRALEEERGKKADLEAEESEETEKLTKLGDEAAAKEAKLQLERARQLDQRANDRLLKTNAEIAQAIGSSSGLPFLRGAVAPVKGILSEMERENILPADISEGFIDRVLARATCICGHPHDSETHDAWQNYRKKTLLVA